VACVEQQLSHRFEGRRHRREGGGGERGPGPGGEKKESFPRFEAAKASSLYIMSEGP